MLRKLKNLFEFLPVSRRAYTKTIVAFTRVIGGLIEAEANHCQIETSIIQQLHHDNQQQGGAQPTVKKMDVDDPAFG